MGINVFRKCFYVSDILMILIVLASLLHCAIEVTGYLEILLSSSLLLRINICILLYRREQWSIVPILVYIVFFGIIYTSGIFHESAIMRMAELPEIIIGNYVTLDLYAYMKPAIALVFAWMWLAPFFVYVIQTVCKRLVCNEYRWYDIAVSAIFKDRVGKLLLSVGALAFVSVVFGCSLDVTVTKYAVLTIPLVAYHVCNRFICRKPHWAEYIILFNALFIFYKAQYEIDNKRIVYLVINAAIIFAVCTFMFVKSRALFATLMTLAFLMVLPSLSIGYYIYCCTDGIRERNGIFIPTHGTYMYLFRSDIVDGHCVVSYGLRDRYHEVIPCKYKWISPSRPCGAVFDCITHKGDTVIYNIHTAKVIER